jgi:uroporphyrinogen III methyltransferase / synthase
MKVGRVWYVGAGPGDPDLISVRGQRLLQEAQLVIHDSGVATDLLAQCASDAELYEACVSDQATTEELPSIAHRIIEAIKEGLRVVRLKVGDPLFFSRALDEIAELSDAGIVVQVLPGIASPLGAAAFAGVPLTGESGAGNVSFLSTLPLQTPSIIRNLVIEYARAAESVCVLCTQAQLLSVVPALLELPRWDKASSVLISKATTPEQVVVEASLDRLLDTFSARPLLEPFMLMVGNGAQWRRRLDWYERLPLRGRRLLLCRPKHQAQQSAQAIRERGARPVLIPLIEIEPPADPAPLRACVTQLSSYDWVILTSANGTEQLMQSITAGGRDARALGRARIAVIGPGTARPLSQWGIVPDLVAKEHVAEGLARELLASGQAHSALLVRAQEARDVLPVSLREAGLAVTVVPAYATRKLGAHQSSQIRGLLQAGGIDAALLTSSSMADALVTALGSNAAEELSRTCVASIGPITTSTLEKAGVRVDVTAEVYTVEGLLDSLEQLFAARQLHQPSEDRC